MKKVMTAFMIAALFFAMTACGAEPQSASERVIKPAELTEQEQNILDLYGVEDEPAIFDFTLDDTVRSARVTAYELVDGKWEVISDSLRACKDTEGRLGLFYDEIGSGMRISDQSEHSKGSSTFTTKDAEATEGMARAESLLSAPVDIEYDVEIPLIVQVVTTGGDIVIYNVDEAFKSNEAYEEYGYDYVYAVTITFSQKTTGELD